jgi:acyl carrier protein
MTTTPDPSDDFKTALKAMIIEECDKDMAPAEIGDQQQLIGGDLDLDSLDALQICIAVQNRYGVRIKAGPEARQALESVDTLAQTIAAREPAAS